MEMKFKVTRVRTVKEETTVVLDIPDWLTKSRTTPARNQYVSAYCQASGALDWETREEEDEVSNYKVESDPPFEIDFDQFLKDSK